MSDLILFAPQRLLYASRSISERTQHLQQRTPSLLDEINSISQQLPSEYYEQAYWQIMRARAFLNRSMEIRDRICMFLESAATAAQQLDQDLAQTFSDYSSSNKQ
ncbi:hypothetical protein [Thermogemmatispora sp.]|uniref:hypothetical protein n=1 Tax=Thermogemmatispora sp. TaxID=1968838 RepID=UPI001DADC0D7|nr:hypothetical protein [Thermogemmatispora sp.]MBX5450407.1 hypothetical protein [Thermogemmatispora sp.]